MTATNAIGQFLTFAPPADADGGLRSPAGFNAVGAAYLALSAHVVELRQSEIIDNAAFRLIARSLVVESERGSAGEAPDFSLARVEETVDGGLPAGMRGVATLGLAREEWGATVERMAWRHASLEIFAAVSSIVSSLYRLAEVHAVTVMPAFIGGRLAQPTTLAHYLGGIIEPLRTQRIRLREGFARLNRSPQGAGILSGGALALDRDDLARQPAFDGILPNTFDAVTGVEDLVELVDGAVTILTVIQRFVSEMLVWHRTDPTSFLVDERWLRRPEPSHPALEIPVELDRLAAALGQMTGWLDGVRRELRSVPYGPVGGRRDRHIRLGTDVGERVASLVRDAARFVNDGLIVNRAYLGNRAGRGLVTGGDLAFYLMTEEQVPPAAALEITSLVLAQLHDANLEVSNITQDMIDSAALLTIGQEIKVEMETMGRYLAPRRYLERRQATGTAAPAMTRAWLEDVAAANGREDAWLAGTVARINDATAALRTAIVNASNESPDD